MAPKKKEEPKVEPKPKAPEPEPVKIPEFDPKEITVQTPSLIGMVEGEYYNVMTSSC